MGSSAKRLRLSFVIIEPRKYQADDVNYAMGHGREDRVIHCAPTGSGKTVIQALICKREFDRGDSTAILTPRNEIFNQTYKTVGELVGYENVSRLRARRKGEAWDSSRPVHVVSWPTLIARARRNDFWFPKVQRLLVDECHLSIAPKILEILKHYAPKARIDGYTATPARMTGKGLGAFFTEIKHVTSVRQLIKDKWLAPVEYYGGELPSLEGIKISKGDYETKKLSNVCVELVGDAVDNWLRLASDRHTIVFSVDIAHCEALAERFQESGIKAAALHTGMDDTERDSVVAAFKSQKIQVLVNVSIASYGFDAPSVNCIQICRPTRSIVLHLQMIGRGMRPKEDDSECMVLDHAGNVRALGMADDLFRWSLDMGNQAATNWTRHSDSGEAEEAKQHTCDNCKHIFASSRVCPKCGWAVPFTKRDIAAVEADLVPIGKNTAEKLPEGFPKHDLFYSMLLYHAVEKGWSNGWAYHKFIEKAKCPPLYHWQNNALVPPSARVKNWIHSRMIAYAQARKKEKQQGSSQVSG
jgi:superfamily II DNA or RNA helicase